MASCIHPSRSCLAPLYTIPLLNCLFTCYIFIDEVVVGLARTVYKVNEDNLFITVCAIIISPSVECAIGFPFQIQFSLSSNTAGKNIIMVLPSSCPNFAW